MRPATDMTPAVVEAFMDVIREVSARHGEPRLRFNPVWINRDGWWARETAATWFLPTAGMMTNHTLSVAERGHETRVWTVYASAHRGPVSSQELVLRAAPGLQTLRHTAGMVGLLDYTSPVRYVEGTSAPEVDVSRPGAAMCPGIPGVGRAFCPCGRPGEHAPHVY